VRARVNNQEGKILTDQIQILISKDWRRELVNCLTKK